MRLTTVRLFVFLAIAVSPAPRPANAQGNLEMRVDAIFSEWDTANSPGCTLGVVRDGELVYSNGYGMADLERGVAITPETVFYLGSVSKQFTAASIALLAEQGRLSLGDEVRKYVHELPEYDTPITIRHLVHHMSGVRDYYALYGAAGEDWGKATLEGTLSLIARQQGLNFPPGDQYLYSNSGYILLTAIVQRVSGQSLREYTQAQIFGPLHMGKSGFHDDHRIEIANRAYSYGGTVGDGFELTFLPTFELVGAGGVLSTIPDLVRWDQNFYDGTVGGQSFLERIHTRGVLNSGDTLAYAFGNNIGSYKGQRTVSHGGALMGFRTALLRFPDQRFSTIILCNLGSINPSALANQVADIYLKDLFEEHLAQYAGTYYAEELDVEWTVRVEDASLVFEWGDNSRTAQSAAGDDSFRYGGGVAQFLRDAGTRVSGFTIDAGRARGMRFERLP